VEERARIAKAKDFEDFCYAVIRSVHGMLDEPTTNRLAEVKQPTLVIFGEKDGLIPNPILHGGESKDIAAIGTKAIPNVALIMIPEAGHMVHMEKPAEFNQTVLSWLK
jgi:pimeloyl-ACP methyl ester carboxylesterase